MVERQIFLSHRSLQKPVMRRLKTRLDKRRIKSWLDETHIPEFEPIDQRVKDGIGASHGLLLWWFGDYIESEACRDELLTALGHCAAEGSHAITQRIFVAGPKAALDAANLGDLRSALSFTDLDPEPSDAQLDRLAKKLAENLPDGPPFGGIDAIPGTAGGAATLPSDTAFVGRSAELFKLFVALAQTAPGVSAQVRTPPPCLVAGMGGQGKTVLAREYARRFARLYPAGVLYLTLRGDGDDSPLDSRIDSARIDAALALVRDAQLDPDPLINAQRKTAWRETIKDRAGADNALATLLAQRGPYLWLVDDVPSAATIAQIDALRPPSGAGVALFTARAALPGTTPFPLDALSPADALRLLRRLAGTHWDDTTLNRLIAHVHRHALAVSLIGHALANGQMPDQFLAPVQGPALAALEAACARMPHTLAADSEHLKPIVATLMRTLALVPAASVDRQALGLLAQLAPASVPDTLLRAAMGEDDFPAAISTLRRFGLVERPVIGAVPCTALHALMAQVVLFVPDYLPAGGEALLESVDAALIADCQAIIKDTGHFRRDPTSPLLAPHAAHRAVVPLDADRIVLAHTYAQALYHLGRLPEARALEEAVLEVCRRVQGPEHPNTLGSMNNLAVTLRAQGDHAGARALEEEALAVRRRVQGPEHPDTLTSMNNLAGTLGAQGDHAGARALQEAVLPLRRRVLGPEHPDTLTSMNNLAGTLWAQGDHAGARALEEEALAVRRRVLGPEHPDTLTSMNNLAVTLLTQGDYARARALQEEALAVRRRVLGPEHPNTLGSMNNLALTLKAQGDHAGARALEEEALAVRRRVQGPEHPDTLTSMNNLAGTLGAQGDHAGARALQEAVLAVRRRVLGSEHPDTLTSMNDLAHTLGAQGDNAGARALQEEALAVRRRVLGPEHPDTLTSMNNLAATLWAQGDYAGARALQEAALAVRRRVQGPEHPYTLTSLDNLASTLGAQGDYAEARALQEEVLAVSRRVLGPEHPDTLTSMNNLASMLKAQGDHAGARALQEEVLAVSRRVLGPEHPDTLTSMNNLALTLGAQGDYAGARALHEEALAVRRRIRGPEHPDTLLSAYNLLVTLLEQRANPTAASALIIAYLTAGLACPQALPARRPMSGKPGPTLPDNSG